MKTMLDTMLDMGYEPEYLIDDGRIHRFPAPDKRPSNRSAWYVYYGTHGAFGTWSTGQPSLRTALGEQLGLEQLGRSR